MKNRKVKQLLALLLASATMLTACGTTGKEVEKDNTEVGSSQTEADESKDQTDGELATISLYPANANLTSGLVTGHRADYFAENGIELEVWAYSDEKTNAILASGDLPDIMYVKKGDQLDTMIEAGMVLNLEEYLDQLPHLYSSEYMEGALEVMREKWSAGTGELYALPIAVGEAESAWARLDSTDRNTVKLRWDVYEEIGAPEINDYWELIDVMEQMLAAHPQEEDGTKCYGMFLDNGLDSDSLGAMLLWYQWQGYTRDNLPYMLETNKVTGESTSILSKDSLYYEGLKWYNEVYRRGLMDPESINTDRGTQAKKVDAGLAMVPAGTLPGWAAGNYFEYYIPGTNIYFDYISETGDGGGSIVVNANTEHLDACLKLLDMWCDPDAYLRIQYGPEGDIWYSEGETVHLTDGFIAWLEAGNANANGYVMSDGTEWALWNTGFCVNQGVAGSYKDSDGDNVPGTPTKWDECLDIITESENYANWQKTTGYSTWKEWITEENAFYVDSPVDEYSAYLTSPSDSMNLIIDSLKNVVVPAGWKMIYAETDKEFDAIWDQMVADCEGLGAQDVIDWKLADIEAAKELAAK